MAQLNRNNLSYSSVTDDCHNLQLKNCKSFFFRSSTWNLCLWSDADINFVCRVIILQRNPLHCVSLTMSDEVVWPTVPATGLVTNSAHSLVDSTKPLLSWCWPLAPGGRFEWNFSNCHANQILSNWWCLLWNFPQINVNWTMLMIS